MQEKNTPYSRIALLLVAFAFIWLLAVVKVFLLEKSRVHSEEAGDYVSEFASRSKGDDDTKQNIPVPEVEIGTFKYRSKRDSMKNYNGGAAIVKHHNSGA